MKRLLLAIIIGGYSSYEHTLTLDKPWQSLILSSVILEAIGSVHSILLCMHSHYILSNSTLSYLSIAMERYDLTLFV